MSHHIWNMKESDINDNLVTFSTMQHIRLKIKQEKKVLSYFQEGLSSFLFHFYTVKSCYLFGWALIVISKVLWVTGEQTSAPHHVCGRQGKKGGFVLKCSSQLTSQILQTSQLEGFILRVSACLALSLIKRLI